MEYYNHLKIGGQEFLHKGKRIISSINSLDIETYVDNFKNYDYDIGIVPAGFEHRADLISEVFYNTPTLDWLICWANDVSDPFQQLNVGDTLKIPKLI